MVNLEGIVVDAMLDDAGIAPLLANRYAQRKGHWRIAVEVYSDKEKDCLQPDSFSREPVLKYLRNLKLEYQTTHNYNETVFKD